MHQHSLKFYVISLMISDAQNARRSLEFQKDEKDPF